MSGIGTAASILQLASAATKISFQAYEFITTIKNAPREIENLGSDMMNFYLLVNNLTDALESRDIRGFVDQDAQLNKAMKSLFIPMAKCQLSCDQVNEKLKLLDFQTDPESEGLLSEKNASGDEPKKSRTWVRDWMWPFRRREIFAMMTEFDRSRSIFSDSMSSLTLYALFSSSIHFANITISDNSQDSHIETACYGNGSNLQSHSEAFFQ